MFLTQHQYRYPGKQLVDKYHNMALELNYQSLKTANSVRESVSPDIYFYGTVSDYEKCWKQILCSAHHMIAANNFWIMCSLGGFTPGIKKTEPTDPDTFTFIWKWLSWINECASERSKLISQPLAGKYLNILCLGQNFLFNWSRFLIVLRND